jgi:hypothetical protein
MFDENLRRRNMRLRRDIALSDEVRLCHYAATAQVGEEIAEGMRCVPLLYCGQ